MARKKTKLLKSSVASPSVSALPLGRRCRILPHNRMHDHNEHPEHPSTGIAESPVDEPVYERVEEPVQERVGEFELEPEQNQEEAQEPGINSVDESLEQETPQVVGLSPHGSPPSTSIKSGSDRSTFDSADAGAAQRMLPAHSFRSQDSLIITASQEDDASPGASINLEQQSRATDSPAIREGGSALPDMEMVELPSDSVDTVDTHTSTTLKRPPASSGKSIKDILRGIKKSGTRASGLFKSDDGPVAGSIC